VDGDRTPPVRRTTVAEAAELLGISAEAVRGRIRRGTIPVEREGGTVYVLLEHPAAGRTTADQPRTTTDRPDDRTDALIAALEGQVADLREQLRAERQGHAEARRIIAGLVERIPPQIEPPTEAPGGPETATEQPGRVEPQPSVGGAQEPAEPRSWWRRLWEG
jgi:hypothetical protein